MTSAATAERPVADPPRVDNIPGAMKARRQWVCWCFEQRKGKWTKPPKQARKGPGGEPFNADNTDPRTWTTFEAALAAYRGGGYDGIGYVFAPDDGACFVDLDNAIDENGQLKPWAAEVVRRLDTYTEVSPSKTGLHLFALGWKPPRGAARAYHDGKAEVYGAGRFSTVTGETILDNPVAERPDELRAFHAEVTGPRGRPAAGGAAASNGKASGNGQVGGGRFKGKGGPTWPADGAPWTDEDVVRLARHCNKGFAALYDHGSAADYGGDQSRADAALAECVLWWTGGDTAWAERIMRGSQLVRDKWDSRRGEGTYLSLTLANIKAKMTAFRKPGERAARGPGVNAAPRAEAGGDAAGDAAGGDEPRTAYAILLSYLRDRYVPVFRRPGLAVFSQAYRREVEAKEALFAPGIDVLNMLAHAADAPRTKDGDAIPSRLPGLFQTYGKSAWFDLCASLPEEDRAEEVDEDAEAEFRHLLTGGLLTMMTLGETTFQGGEETTTTQRRAAVDWAVRLAKPGPWRAVRSYCLWSRRRTTPGGVDLVEVAFRAELFTQLAYRPLAAVTQNRLGRLCQQYGVGVAAGDGDRPHGRRAILLSQDFLGSLVSPPADHAEEEEGTGHAE